MENPDIAGSRAQTDETNDLAEWLDYCEHIDAMGTNDDVDRDAESTSEEDALLEGLWQDALDSDWTENE